MITDEEIGKVLLILNIIWFAMLVSLAVYLFVGLRVATNLRASMNEDTFAVLRSVLYGLAFVTLFVTKYIRNYIMSGKDQTKQTQNYHHPVLQRYTIAMIIAWALSESIGIYGLVLFFLGKNSVDLYILIIISAVAMFIYRPKKDEITTLAQRSREAANSVEGAM